MHEAMPGVDCHEGGRRPLLIGGIVPFSTVDWPGKLACVAFLAGCPWRCPYCQNAELQRASAATLTDADLFALLHARRGLLDGVVFSGGEPLAQPGVVEAMREAREQGFAIGLHTCGAFPERLSQALPYVDWVGLDVKAPWDAYDRVTRAAGTGELAQRSLELILEAGVAMEARTTWHPSLLAPEDLTAIAQQLAELGVPAWRVQAYRPDGTTGLLPKETVYPSDVPEAAQSAIADYAFRRA